MVGFWRLGIGSLIWIVELFLLRRWSLMATKPQPCDANDGNASDRRGAHQHVAFEPHDTPRLAAQDKGLGIDFREGGRFSHDRLA